jgi:sRNA-binding carbon storage regulator CsrA
MSRTRDSTNRTSLTLGRSQGQALNIGPDITVTVGRRVGGRTRITVTAPPEVQISRAEAPPRPEGPDADG